MGIETKLKDEGFTGAAVVELLTHPEGSPHEAIKAAVPSGKMGERLHLLHHLRRVVRPSPPPPPTQPQKPPLR